MSACKNLSQRIRVVYKRGQVTPPAPKRTSSSNESSCLHEPFIANLLVLNAPVLAIAIAGRNIISTANTTVTSQLASWPGPYLGRLYTGPLPSNPSAPKLKASTRPNPKQNKPHRGSVTTVLTAALSGKTYTRIDDRLLGPMYAPTKASNPEHTCQAVKKTPSLQAKMQRTRH